MKSQIKIEKVKGNYHLLGILIIALIGSGGLVYYIFPSNVSPSKETNQVKIQENKNSPVANKIETQNNYYGNTHVEAKDSFLKKNNVPKPIITSSTKKAESYTSKITYKDTVPKESTQAEKKSTTINANNALIVTNGQSGGSNTVNLQQIPKPTIKINSIAVHNEVVKEITTTRGPHKKTIPLPSGEYNYDSLYKTQFTFSYNCSVNLNEIGFMILREDVIFHRMTHIGMMNWSEGYVNAPKYPVYLLKQPENSIYSLLIYTVKKFGNPSKEFDYFLNKEIP